MHPLPLVADAVAVHFLLLLSLLELVFLVSLDRALALEVVRV